MSETSSLFKKVRPAGPQPFPAFVAPFGGVGLMRGAYPSYVSTEKWRERRWRIFSTGTEKKGEEVHRQDQRQDFFYD